MSQNKPTMALGLMSGTSADGVDAALVRTDGEDVYEYIDALTVSYPSSLQHQLIAVAQQDIALSELLLLENRVTQIHADASRQLLNKHAALSQNLGVIGFHGHTIRHDKTRCISWQIGNASLLSAKLGCDVVSDFRRRDMAFGGHGAPLAPLFHRLLFRDHPKPTGVLNLGGVGNLTYLGENDELMAGDTGPGCGLLDTLARRELGTSFDCGGKLAANGCVQQAFVDAAMQLDFFSSPIPRSADRFDFASIDLSDLSAADQAATLCAITVAGVQSVVNQLPNRPSTIWVTGGGSNHPVLMAMLDQAFGGVVPIEAAGYRSDSLEAECFGWLAVRRLRGLPTSLPETTGCQQPTCGGSITLGDS